MDEKLIIMVIFVSNYVSHSEGNIVWPQKKTDCHSMNNLCTTDRTCGVMVLHSMGSILVSKNVVVVVVVNIGVRFSTSSDWLGDYTNPIHAPRVANPGFEF